MATITVSFDGSDLILSDNGHTNAGRSEQIIWQPEPNGRVQSVTSVTVKPTSPKTTAEFWSNPPNPTGVNVMGRISGTVLGAWDYDITCNVGTVQAPISRTKDPRIQVLSE
jgi:hypothetical protein